VVVVEMIPTRPPQGAVVAAALVEVFN
jgi:hypothetical protein